MGMATPKIHTSLSRPNQREADVEGTWVEAVSRLLLMTKAGPGSAERSVAEGKTADPSTTLLRSSPGFPVETRGFDEMHAVFFNGKPHTWYLPAARGRKSGSGRDDKGRTVTHFEIWSLGWTERGLLLTLSSGHLGRTER